MNGMRAGQLRHRLCIEQSTTSLDSYNQDIPTWTTFATCWGMIQDKSGVRLQLQTAFTVAPTATHLITIRYVPNLSVNMRIRFGAYPFGCETLELDQFEQLTCDELEDLDTYQGGPPKIYTINYILDTEQRHREIMILATEVPQ